MTSRMDARPSLLARFMRGSTSQGIAFAALTVTALTIFGADFQLQRWTQWAALCLLAMSFVWVWGFAGIFSFAQVAFFGVGAYAYGFASINMASQTNETLSAIFIASLAGAILAAIVGYFLFYGQVSGVYVAIATLALTLVFYTLTSSLSGPQYKIGKAAVGGFNGMVGIPPLQIPGIIAISTTQLFAIIGGITVLVGATIAILRQSSFGRVVRAIQLDETRTRLLGYSVPAYKLAVFAIGGAIAGLAGALYAGWSAFIDPSVFGLRMATMLVIWVLVGGRTSLIGAVLGVFFVQQVSTSIAGTGSVITPLFLGIILIVVVLVVPTGFVPAFASWIRRLVPGATPSDAVSSASNALGTLPDLGPSQERVTLEVAHVVRKFGGVTAVNDVDLNFGDRGIRVLLGPNGAGKSTLFQLLMGTYTPTSGAVLLDGVDISSKSPDQRARSGMAIKLQVASPFSPLSVRENLWLAAYGPARNKADAERIAAALSNWLGYGDGLAVMAGSIAHGKQQWLDIGTALAMRPAVLLLDEPAAGLGRAESTRIADLIRELSDDILVVVVEHDMQFVQELDSPVSVLHQGRLLAEGTLAEIRANEQVLDVYLGRGARVED